MEEEDRAGPALAVGGGAKRILCKLKASDGAVFEVEEGVAFQSRVVKNLLAERSDENDYQVLEYTNYGPIGAAATASSNSCNVNKADLDAGDVVVPCDNISSPIMRLLIEFCRQRMNLLQLPPHHHDITEEKEPPPKDHTWSSWSSTFLAHLDTATLCQLASAADFLHIPSLMDCTATQIAGLLSHMSLDRIQRILELQQPAFTAEQEQELFLQNRWAFDD